MFILISMICLTSSIIFSIVGVTKFSWNSPVVYTNTLVFTAFVFQYLAWRKKLKKLKNEKVRAEQTQALSNVEDERKRLKSCIHKVSNSISQQAANVQQTATAISEIKSMSLKNVNSVKESKLYSDRSSQAVEEGKRQLDDVLTSMKSVSETNKNFGVELNEHNQKVKGIIDLISEIRNKTNIIDDIVFQTKLLAFNASVEAARAGVHGKGFAVVAEEVGNLAGMSGKASKEISELLESSTQEVKKIVEESQRGVEKLLVLGDEKMKNSTTKTIECMEVFTNIHENVHTLNQMMDNITNASGEQSLGIEEIVIAIQDLDKCIQKNATILMSENTLESHDSFKKINKDISHESNVVEFKKSRGESPSSTSDYSMDVPSENDSRFIDL